MSSFREFLLESISFTVPWDDSFDKSISKWESKYKININADKDTAVIEGNKVNLEKFLSKELDYEDNEFEMLNFPGY